MSRIQMIEAIILAAGQGTRMKSNKGKSAPPSRRQNIAAARC